MYPFPPCHTEPFPLLHSKGNLGDDCLGKLLKLKIKLFEWKSTGKKDIGIFAQELKGIFQDDEVGDRLVEDLWERDENEALYDLAGKPTYDSNLVHLYEKGRWLKFVNFNGLQVLIFGTLLSVPRLYQLSFFTLFTPALLLRF
jgi:hypothetical protein